MKIKDMNFPEADNESDWNTSFESNPYGVSAISTLNKNFEKKLQKFIDRNYISKEKIQNEIEKLQKENEELKEENNRLKVIKYDIDYGTESVNLIPKSTLVEINTNRYMIEIEDGKFIDLKQVYQENKTLKELHIQDNKHLDFIMKNSIPIQKVKDQIEELSNTKGDFATYIAVSERIKALQKLLESEEK